MDNNTLSMSTVAAWDKQAVDEFLRKNRIYGCTTVIEEKGLDGIGFLNLDLTTVKSLGLTLVERCKINALLNSLAPEVERKAFTSSWSEHPGMNQNNVHSSNRMQSTTTKTIYPPVPIKPLHLQRISNEKLCSAAPAQVIPPETPTLPNIGIIRPFPVNKAKIKATDDTLECDEEIYEVLKSPAIVIRENMNDWDGECDLFSSDEFSDSDDEAPQSNKRENHRIESGKKSDCEKLRQPDPTSTPPPLPVRNKETFGGSTPSLNSDRSDAPRKISLPAPSVPPPPPPSRSLSISAVSGHRSTSPSPLPRSPKEPSTGPEKCAMRKREDDKIASMPWYCDMGRRDAERSLRQCVEGAFLVRPTEHGGKDHRYTVSIIFNRRIFHIPVRQKPDGRWALGSAKDDEETFENVEKLVDEHRWKPINLHTDGRVVGTTCLVIWPSSKTF